MTVTTTVHRGRWSLGDRLELMLRELPFEVTPGAAAVTVELEFDREQGVLDLGCLGADAFRGWSGGARDTYTVAVDWATPGYLKGELEPGLWHVLLRLHRIPPGGLDYEVRVTTSTTRPAPLPPPAAPKPVGGRPPARERRDIPASGEMLWYAGDFHSHTVHSDGALTVPELAWLACDEGLDFLAVTDHNTVSHHPELPAVGARYGIRLLPGQEVTRDEGHANVFGDTGWVDFRQPADSWYQHARTHGGVMSLNHPLGSDCAWRLPLADRPRHAEVWHSGWFDRRWGAPLSWAQAWRPDVIAIGGSDFHRHGNDGRPGSPTTWLLAEDDSPAALLAALAAGRTAVSAGPGAPLLLRLGDELLALGAEGTALIRPDGRRELVHADRTTFPAESGLHRLESYENEVTALCQ
ncbi:CehA/McbA family metallohydrolase [Streptomyces sp. NBC_01717]|uniref:CehA/McbA family metallohydrolase n=1 Tax=Streptomyces sp. NBC_01717 TaxID=2975918 RepID=UPI002E344C2C|nr:CehA/McbA family metallohydrolase [Streptomyces sp. NBC_01717]